MMNGIIVRTTAVLAAAVLFFPAASWSDENMKHAQDRNGVKYEYIENDPFNVRIYRLPNGLALYLAKNPAKPRVNVMTAVRTGSVNDPENSTGLAHYFEHMMFKGTPRMGSLDWKKEKPLLDRISDLFEQRRAAKTESEKKKIYAEIDKLSNEAAKYASPGEFSKLVSSIGGSNLNAGTSNDFTVYYGEVPANELGKYLILDSERFTSPVLRLFHTELETVYEEYNIHQDRDSSRAYSALRANLFPNHPLGREIIGYPEHLKNPSMKDIYAFYDTWYTPGNMALLIAGDLDYEKAYADALATFGKLPSKKTSVLENVRPAEPLEKNVRETVSGPEPEMLLLGWKLPRTRKNVLLLSLVQRLLSDNGSGLFDKHLVRSQKILGGGVYPTGGRDNLILMMTASPRKGQTLDEASTLLLNELERIKQGDYEDWRIPAVADNLRVELENMKTGDGLDILYEVADSFLNGRSYADTVNMPEEIAKFTKKDVSAFLEKNLKHYVRIDKKTGKPDRRVKVKKPLITPVALNPEKESEYAKNFLALPAALPVKPEFIHPRTAVSEKKLPNGITVVKVKKSLSKQLFQAKRIVEYGKFDSRKLALALDYLEYAGTDRYSPDALREEFYKLGLRFEFSSDRNFSSVELSGPAVHFRRGMELLDHFIRNAKADHATWISYVDGILKLYADKKLKAESAFLRAVYYAWNGPENPLTFLPSEKMLRETDPGDLLKFVRELFTEYPSYFVCDGPPTMGELEKTALLLNCSDRRKLPVPKEFPTRKVVKPKVYLVNFDTVQLRVGFASRGGVFTPGKIASVAVFNEYFCQGLDSIVFQEIRESRGLAYSAGGSYAMPMRKNSHDLIYMLLGTQPDKLFEASDALCAILKKMPLSEPKFAASRDAVRKSIATERIYGVDVFQFLLSLRRMGVTEDYRKAEYAELGKMTLADLEKFFNSNLAGLRYDVLIVGRTKTLDRKKLSEFGEVVELSLKDVFGY